MADSNVRVNLQLNADTSQAKKQMQDLYKSLQAVSNLNTSTLNMDADLIKAANAAEELEMHLKAATNVNTGKLNLIEFNKSLTQSQTSLAQLITNLANGGNVGQQAFAKLATQISQTQVPLRQTNALIGNMMNTLKNTVKWELSSSFIHGIEGTFSQAVSYVKDLNSSLNNIRIVTGQSMDDMARFAEQANKTAKTLSTTTKEYTDAALIFYQQGLDDKAVKERVDVVMKMANVTKDSAAEVSSYMTAIWNNFDDGAESLEHYADVITALGASTASSSAEIAAGLEKFASIGKTIGLSYEYATSALATLVANTRQSSETVGNGLRTIFSRLQGLKLGETLEDGVDLNKYSAALNSVGVQILDQAGNLKEMDTILYDLASKWDRLSNAQQMALAQTVGGVRQFTTLISLMEHWDDMKENLDTAEKSTGSLQSQADIYAESWDAASKRVKTSMQNIYSSLIDEKSAISLLKTIEQITDGIGSFIKTLGGANGIVTTFSALMLKAFSGKIVAGVQNIAASITNLFKSPSQQFTKILTDTNKILSVTADGTNSSSIKATSQLIALKQSLLDKEQYLTSSQQAAAQAGLDAYAGQISKLKELEDGYNSVEAANERLIESIGRLGGQELDKIIKSFNLGKNGGTNWNILSGNDFNQFNRATAGDQSRQAFALYNRASIAEGVSANALGNVSDRALNGLPDEQKLIQIKTALESIQSVAQGTPFENYFKGLNAETLLNDSKALNEFKQKLLEFNAGAAQDTEVLGQKLDAALSKIKNPQLQASLQSLKTKLSEGSISGAQALSELEAMLQKTDASAEKLKNSFQSFPTTLQAAVSSIANVASGMLMSVNAGKSLANTIKTLGDTSASGADKIGAIASSGTTAIMSLSMMISAVKGLAVAFGAAQAAAGWIGLIGAAIAGVVMWLSASSQAEANAAKEAAEAAKKAHKESLKATQEIVDTKKTEADANHDVLKTFNELYAQKQAGQSVDEQLATAALNLAAAYGVTDTAMARLSGNYDILIAKAKQYAVVQSEQALDSARDAVTAAEGVVASTQINSSAYSDKQSFVYKQSPEWLINQGYGGARLEKYTTTRDAFLTGITFYLYQPKSGTKYQVSGIKLTDKGGYSSSSGYNVIGDEGNDTYTQIAEQTGLDKYIAQYDGQASLLVSNQDSFEYRSAVYDAVGETVQLMRKAGATNNSFYSGLLDYYASMADEMATYKAAMELVTTEGKNVLSAKLIGLENITNYADFETIYQDLYNWAYEHKDDLGIDSTLTGEDLTSVISNLVYDIICESTDLDLYTAVRGAIYEAFTPSNDSNADFHREMAETIARNYGVAAITDDILAEVKKITPTEGVTAAEVVTALMSSERGSALLSQSQTRKEMAQGNVTQGQIVSAQGLLKKNMTSAESNSLYKSLLGSGVGWDSGETPEAKMVAYGEFLALTYEEQQAYLEGLASQALLDLNAMAQTALTTAQTLYDNAQTAYNTARAEHIDISDVLLNSAISFVDSIGQTSFDQNGQLVYSGSDNGYATWIPTAWATAQEVNPDISQADFLASLPSQVIDLCENFDGLVEIVNAYLDLQSAQTGLDTAQIDAQTAAWNAQRVEVNQLTKDVTSLASFISKGPSSTSEWREFLRLMQETDPTLTMETVMGWDDSARSSNIAAASAAKRNNAMSDSAARAKYKSDGSLRSHYGTYEAWKTAYNTDGQNGTIMSDAEYATLVTQDNTIQAANRSAQFDATSQQWQNSLSIVKEYQSVLSSIKLDSLATMGDTEWTRFINILKQAKIEYRNLTKEAFLQKTQLEQITAIAEAQAAEYRTQNNIYTQLAQEARRYAEDTTLTDAERATWKAKQIEYENLATQASIDAENALTQSITDKIKVYEAAIDRLQKAENVDKQNAEKSKSVAETLTGAIETGALTEAQKTLLKSNGFDLDASGWNEAADATARAAIAAQAWSTYANNIKSYGDTLVATYDGAAEAVEKLADNIKNAAIGDKTKLPDLLTANNITDEAQVGALLKAWDSLIAKGKEASSIALADLATEARSMGATITSEVDAAVAASTDAMNSVFHQMAQQHIASAQAAANAWKNAFAQIANFRKSLLEGDDILSQIAGNPEAFAQGLASYRKTHPEASAQDFYAAVANGNVKASDLQYTPFDINQYMADTGRSFVTKDTSIYGKTHFGTIADENTMPAWAKTDRVGWWRNRDAQALVDNGQAADFSSAQVMLNDWYTAAFKKMVKEDGTTYTDSEIGALVTRIQQGDLEAYRLLSAGLDRIENYAEITADASRLNTARQEATSALNGVQNDTTRTAEFRKQQKTESELNDLNAAISAAQKIKEQEGRWEDIDANSRRILEENGITSFDGLSGAATDCAGALAVLAGAAEAAAQAQLGKAGTYKNGNEYGQILDKDGNLVELRANADGKYDAARFLAGHEGEGYTFNTDRATTTAMSTMATTTQVALDTQTDTKQSEILSEAKSAGFASLGEQEEYVRLAVERNDIASAEEMIEQGICKTKEQALELQREYANQLKKCERGLKSLADNGKKWAKTVKEGTASLSDQQAAIKGLRQGYKDILNLADSEADALNAEFLTNSEMLKLAKTAASNSGTKGQQALNKLQAAAAAAITPFDDMEAGLDKVAQAIADVNLQAGELFTGADYSMVDSYWDSVVAKCTASGASIESAVATANAALSSLGVVNPGFEVVTEEMTVDGFKELIAKTGSKTVTVPDGANGTKQITLDEFQQQVTNSGGTSIPFTYIKGKGAPDAYKKKGEKPGGGGSSGGGGGGGRDPRRTNHSTKKPERYHRVDQQIKSLDSEYKKLQQSESKVWNQQKIDLMDKELKLLQAQTDAVRRKTKEAQKYLKLDLAKAKEIGFEFDENGIVTNYNELWDKNLAEYNAYVDKYNSLSAEEQEAKDKKYQDMQDEDGIFYSGYTDYYEKILLTELEDRLSQYEETYDLINSLIEDEITKLNSQYDMKLEQIQTKLDATLKLTKMDLELIDFKLKSIQDNAYRAAEAMSLLGDKMTNAGQEFDAYADEINQILRGHGIEDGIDKIISGAITIDDLIGLGLTAGEIEKITGAMTGMKDSVENVSDDLNEIFSKMSSSFESYNSDLSIFSDRIEHFKNITSTYKNILDLTGKSANGLNVTIVKQLNERVVLQAQTSMNASKTYLDSLKLELELAQKAYDQALATGNETAIQTAKDTLESTESNYRKAEENFLSSWEATLQAAADAFKNTMERVIFDIGQDMVNGLAGGMSEFQDQFAKLKEQDEDYVDDYEKIYQLTKLSHEVGQKIDNSTNVRTQKELLAFQKEINSILKSDQKLSEYDLDYMRKKYDLKVAELALEEAQNAKSQVSMRRDADGNYNYVYTANAEDVAKAEDEYATKLYEMQKANDEYITSLSDKMANLQSSMLDEIANIDTTIYDTEEKYAAEVARISEHYQTQMAYYSDEMNKAIGNNQDLYYNDWVKFNEMTGYKLSAEEDFVLKFNQTVLSQASGFETVEGYYEKFVDALHGGDPENPTSKSLIGQAIVAYAKMREEMNKANESAGVSTGDLATSILGNVDSITEAADEAAKGMEAASERIITALGEIDKKMDELAKSYGDKMSYMTQVTNGLFGTLSGFLHLYNDSSEWQIGLGDLTDIQIEIKKAESQRPGEGFDTSGYTGYWGSEGRLAQLHQKEFVLNQEDTSNLLASELIRQIANVIDLNALASAGGLGSLTSAIAARDPQQLEQNVHIEADFPNVTDRDQIKDAFNDIINLASQYAYRNI